MHGDFSRASFDRSKHYSGVLAQQGRVTLDADLNEQAAIQQHLLRMFVTDVVGQHAGPVADLGFEITLDATARGKVQIGRGRYYVNGVPAENETDVDFWEQPERYLDQVVDSRELPPSDKAYLVYLKVWERMLTSVQDPALREVALGDFAPDTAVRGKVSWQVHAIDRVPGQIFSELQDPTRAKVQEVWDKWRAEEDKLTARLKVSAKTPADAKESPCNAAPDARYRGLENQLYRVEIHKSGTANGDTKATFTWSRENGSVVFPVAAVSGQKVRLAAAGRDHKLDLDVGDWVEFVDDASAVRGQSESLLRVEDIDAERQWVTLSGPPRPTRATLHPYLRRWDQRPEKKPEDGTSGPYLAKDNAIELVEDVWIDLEDGIRIMFEKGGAYSFGDYWLIPARTLLGDVQWPRDATGGPAFVEPHGVPCYYAPLAFVPNTSGAPLDLRNQFPAQSVPVPPAPVEESAKRTRKQPGS
ncbi:DUF4815 domain-containing protein [Allokutzneria sp. A3M-2-11 16]|uniref:DUF6519 domain-containing protein n=1 Tax=Allokutzneria sp. A3M-2-11 16 TaxID=2962043 RepID=UPI0020B8A7C3|nr:DUF6519 domain-containing protein [Allokutzneria sp. A3M-2-11 16]MCP3804185.1 DUF4815 domain-containing protein [Allokutzneria sp. A3M-2-11 16]